MDLDKTTLDEQQAVNCDLRAEFTKYIREHEPKGVTVSVGGEIGEVGGHNSNVHELHAFMRGYIKALAAKGAHLVGISKISVQTGTAHGGFVAADGKVRTDVKLDLVALEELSRVARTDTVLAAQSSTAPRRCRRMLSTHSRRPARARSTSPPTFRTWSTSTPPSPRR